MKIRIEGMTYRAPLKLLVATEMVGKYAPLPVHTCHIHGFRGTRKEMLWHLKVEHRKELEVA